MKSQEEKADELRENMRLLLELFELKPGEDSFLSPEYKPKPTLEGKNHDRIGF